MYPLSQIDKGTWAHAISIFWSTYPWIFFKFMKFIVDTYGCLITNQCEHTRILINNSQCAICHTHKQTYSQTNTHTFAHTNSFLTSILARIVKEHVRIYYNVRSTCLTKQSKTLFRPLITINSTGQLFSWIPICALGWVVLACKDMQIYTTINT